MLVAYSRLSIHGGGAVPGRRRDQGSRSAEKAPSPEVSAEVHDDEVPAVVADPVSDADDGPDDQLGDAVPELNDAVPELDGAEQLTPTGVTRRWAVIVFQGVGGSISHDLASRIRHLLEDELDTPVERTEIDLWLDTPGGDAHAAYKIGLLLRRYASTVRVVIPDYAKSAGTLLALVGDEIFMGPAAELGPLDAQLGHEGEGMMISALDRTRSLEDLLEMAVNTAASSGAYMLNVTRLSRAEALKATLRFSADFLRPLVKQLDPTIVHWSKTQLEVAVEYGTRLLTSRKVGMTPGLEGLSRKLVEDYPTHGFVISQEEAARLGLPIAPLSEYEYGQLARLLHRRHEEERSNVVTVVDLDEVARAAQEGSDDEGQEGASDSAEDADAAED